MSSKMKMRWIAVCCIWAVALAATYWNGIKIDAVASAREKNEQMRQEIFFQDRNAPKLTQILRSHDALFLPVESIDLGIVAVRSRLGALTAAFALSGLQMQAEVAQAAQDQVPWRLSIHGPLNNVVGFLTALQKYLYLTVQQANIKAAQDANEVDVEIELLLHYQITAPVQDSNTIPQVTTQQWESEAKPL